MNRSDDETEQQNIWRMLSEAGLVEIPPGEFSERLRDVKRLVTMRLRELLDFKTSNKECDSAASVLGTLRGIELMLQAKAPLRQDSPEK